MNIAEPAATGDLSTLPVSAMEPRRHRYRSRLGDRLYRWLSLAVALLMVALLAGIVAVLVGTAWPAIAQLGLGFFTGTVWNSTVGVYGALPFIVGTVLTTAIALLIAVPISIAIAILLTEYAPPVAAAVIGVVVDVAAGVPTIVFGAWALLALVPWLRDTAEPALASFLGWLPLLNPNNSPVGITGEGMFPTGLVLAAMIFPTMVALTRNSFLATPSEMREASLGLGATTWETATRVVLRQARAGVLGAGVLACGRALGETMAVVYIIGTVPRLPQSLFDIGNTISSELLTQVILGSPVPGTLYAAALYELGLILLLLSLLTSLTGRLLTRRLTGVTMAAGTR